MAEIFGQSQSHLQEIFPGHLLHRELISAYRELVARAASAGFELRLASGFRSFQRQSEIWNAKLSAQRPVYGDRGEVLDILGLSARERVFAVLRWSALPGASRHHWGSDIDIWDRSAVGVNYRLELEPREYTGDGPFVRMMAWLESEFADLRGDFFWPYKQDLDAVAPEPWHLSYRPVAERFEQAFELESLRALIEASDIALRDTVLANLDEIHQRYIVPSAR